jgi:hypothetical protein
MANIKVINMFYNPSERERGIGFIPYFEKQDGDIEVSLVFHYNCVLNAWVQMSYDSDNTKNRDMGIVDGFKDEDVKTLRNLLDNKGRSIISQYGGDVIVKFDVKKSELFTSL